MRREYSGLPYQSGELAVDLPILRPIPADVDAPEVFGIWGVLSDSEYRRDGVGDHPAPVST